MKSKDDKSERKGSEAQQSVESLWHLKGGSGSYAEISCIAQKENEPKAVSRGSTVLYTQGRSHRMGVRGNVTPRESRRVVIWMTHTESLLSSHTGCYSVRVRE